MRPRIVPATTREPFLSGFLTKSLALRPIGAESAGWKESPSWEAPQAALAIGRDGWANRRCLAGAAAGSTAEAGVRVTRGLVRRMRRLLRGVGRDALAIVAEAASVGAASGAGSESSLRICFWVVLRGFGA